MTEIALPFLRGLNEQVDPRIAPTGTLAVADNVRATKDGRLIRRRGYATTTLTDTDSVAIAPVRVTTCRDLDVLVSSVGGSHLAAHTYRNSVYVPHAGPDLGLVSRVETQPISGRLDAVTYATSSATANGYTLVCWEYLVGSTYYGAIRVTEDATGSVVYENLAAATGTAALWMHAMGIGNRLYVGYTAIGNIYTAVVLTTDALPWTFSFASQWTTYAISAHGWDWHPISTTHFVVAYPAASTQYLVVETWTAANVQDHTDTTSTSVVAGSISAYSDGTSVWVAWGHASSGVLAHCYTSHDLSGLTSVTVAATTSAYPIAVGAGIGGRATVVWSATGRTLMARSLANAGAQGTAVTRYGCDVGSKPFAVGGQIFVWARTQDATATGLQRRMQLLTSNDRQAAEASFDHVVASPLYRAAYTTTSTFTPPTVYARSSATRRTEYTLAWPEIDAGRVSADSGVTITSARPTVLTWSHDDPARAQCVELDGGLYVAGAVPLLYDGTRLTEQALPAPDKIAAAATAGSGLDGTYTYCACYAWRDALGDVHRSGVCPDGSVTTSGAQSATVTVTPGALASLLYVPTSGVSSLVVEIYRTTESGTVFYLLATKPLAYTDATVVYTDSTTDATLALQPLLYTTGGVVAAGPAPGCDQLCVHQGRLFAACGTRLHYTHVYVRGEAPTWPETFYLDAPGTITGLASLDSVLIVFTETRILALYGDGPNRLGQNAYTTLTPVASEVGCTNSRSVVVFRDGVMFQSARGLELLPRGQGAVVPLLSRTIHVSEYDGDPAYSVLMGTPHVLSAVVRPDHFQVRLLLGSDVLTQTTTRILAWDYQHQTWFTETMPIQAGVAGLWSSDVFVIANAWTPALHRQITTQYVDGSSTAITGTVETGDIRPAGLAAWHRIRAITIVAEKLYCTTRIVTLYVAYNGSDTYSSDTGQWTAVTEENRYEPLRLRYTPVVQKLEAIRVKVTITGEGGVAAALHGLALEVEPKRRPARLPTANRN